MTDRQIEVLEKIEQMCFGLKIIMHPEGGGWQLTKEFSQIIKEQKELNLNEFKNKQ